jgi:hypothetical protein
MTENTSLFDADDLKRKRKTNYVKSVSKDGELTVHVKAETAAKIKKYCRLHNMNCKQFINDTLAERIGELSKTQYDSLSREELLAIVKRLEKDHD